MPVFFDLEQMIAILDAKCDMWKEEFIQEGVRIGEARGMVQGLRRALLALLEQRFSALPPSVAEHMAKVTDADVLYHLILFVQHASTPQTFADERAKTS